MSTVRFAPAISLVIFFIFFACVVVVVAAASERNTHTRTHAQQCGWRHRLYLRGTGSSGRSLAETWKMPPFDWPPRLPLHPRLPIRSSSDLLTHIHESVATLRGTRLGGGGRLSQSAAWTLFFRRSSWLSAVWELRVPERIFFSLSPSLLNGNPDAKSSHLVNGKKKVKFSYLKVESVSCNNSRPPSLFFFLLRVAANASCMAVLCLLPRNLGGA